MRSGTDFQPGGEDPRCANKGTRSAAWTGKRSRFAFDDLAPILPAVGNKKLSPLPTFENRQAGDGRPTKRHRRETDRLKAGLLEIED